MGALEAEEPARQSLIEATRESLLRIALAFGMLNAIVPLLIAALTGAEPLALFLGTLWVAAWVVAIIAVRHLETVLMHPVGRWLLAAAGAAATAATILATGGMDSPVANGANWIGWAATVVVSARVALGIALVLGLGTASAYLFSAGSFADLLSTEDSHRYIAITGLLNPAVIVLVALALAGIFKSVVAAAPGTLWRLRHGEPASTPGLTSLLSNTPAAAPALGGSDPEPGRATVTVAFTPDEATIVAMLADGLAPKEVAHQLGRSTDAVYARIASAKEKAGARTIEHLIALAWRPAT